MKKFLVYLLTIIFFTVMYAIEVETEPGNENNYSVTYMKDGRGYCIVELYYYNFDDNCEYVKEIKTKAFDDVKKIKIDKDKKYCIVYGAKNNKNISLKVRLDLKKVVRK